MDDCKPYLDSEADGYLDRLLSQVAPPVPGTGPGSEPSQAAAAALPAAADPGTAVREPADVEFFQRVAPDPTPWFSAYTQQFYQHLHFNEDETVDMPLACMLVFCVPCSELVF